MLLLIFNTVKELLLLISECAYSDLRERACKPRLLFGLVVAFRIRSVLLFCCGFSPTVLFDWESPKPRLCSKLALFMTSWQMFKLLLQLSPLNSYLPYLRAFQWGTVWPYTSSCIKTTTGQSWKFYFYYMNLWVSNLTCCIFEARLGTVSYSTSLESSQIR